MNEPITIWAIADGRPGHWNQVRGLVEALSRRVMVRDISIVAPTRLYSFGELVRRRWRATDRFADPDLIIGAGHGTHLPMLIARASRGGRAIVLMRPTLPTSAFDLCFVPDTQVRSAQPNVVGTRGALNRIEPRLVSSDRGDSTGLILLGGPSRHVKWDSKTILDQVFEVCTYSGDIRWQISTSRRTPTDLFGSLHDLGLLNATIVDGRKTGPDWLPEQLAKTDVAWVTSDSVSMVYESLTAGAKVGLLTTKLRKAKGKIAQHIDVLKNRGDITLFENWRESRRLVSPVEGLREADRCAGIVLERFFQTKQAVAA